MTAPTPFKPALIFIFVIAVIDVMAMGITIPVLPKIIEQMAGSNADAGFYNGLFIALWAAMQFVCSPLVGSLSDRYGRRPVLLASAIGNAADFVLMALAPDLWWLAAGRIISGVMASSFTTAFAYMADITPPEGRAKAYGMLGAAFSAGFVAGPFIGGVLGEWGSRVPFWAAAALSAATSAYGLLVRPESLPAEKRMAFAWNRANPLGALKLLRSHPELSGLASVNFLLYFAHHLFGAVFVLYAAYRFGWGPFDVGILLALVGVLDMLVQGLLVGRIVKRWGDRRTMVAGLLFGALGIAIMGWAPTGSMFVLAMLPNSLWGLAMPTIQSLMTRRVSESEQGQLQGANNSVTAIAGIIAPLFFGWAYGFTVGKQALIPHPGTTFFIAAAILALGAVLGYFVARKGARRDVSEIRH